MAVKPTNMILSLVYLILFMAATIIFYQKVGRTRVYETGTRINNGRMRELGLSPTVLNRSNGTTYNNMAYVNIVDASCLQPRKPVPVPVPKVSISNISNSSNSSNSSQQIVEKSTPIVLPLTFLNLQALNVFSITPIPFEATDSCGYTDLQARTVEVFQFRVSDCSTLNVSAYTGVSACSPLAVITPRLITVFMSTVMFSEGLQEEFYDNVSKVDKEYVEMIERVANSSASQVLNIHRCSGGNWDESLRILVSPYRILACVKTGIFDSSMVQDVKYGSLSIFSTLDIMFLVFCVTGLAFTSTAYTPVDNSDDKFIPLVFVALAHLTILGTSAYALFSNNVPVSNVMFVVFVDIFSLVEQVRSHRSGGTIDLDIKHHRIFTQPLLLVACAAYELDRGDLVVLVAPFQLMILSLIVANRMRSSALVMVYNKSEDRGVKQDATCLAIASLSSGIAGLMIFSSFVSLVGINDAPLGFYLLIVEAFILVLETGWVFYKIYADGANEGNWFIISTLVDVVYSLMLISPVIVLLSDGTNYFIP
jgi:hypothetical protein